MHIDIYIFMHIYEYIYMHIYIYKIISYEYIYIIFIRDIDRQIDG